MSNYTKKQADRVKSSLFNLIKHDDFLTLPVWYQIFVSRLMSVSSAKTPTAIFSLSDTLLGFVHGLACGDVIDESHYFHLCDLVDVAQNFALANNCKKAA